ncbi:Dicer dimerization domain [Orobanche hederae]
MEYVRECASGSRRPTAPGQCSICPSLYNHRLDTMEVHLDRGFCTKDVKSTIGKTCDKGHEWMVSKTVSNCVEALIGAHYVDGGLRTAIGFMKWLAIETEFKHSWIDDAIKVASLYSYAPKAEDIRILESKLGYAFNTKGLLLEAMTHGSEREGVGYCYQRLEFLGDAALDVLITCYLYQNHRNLDHGMLADLHSASVDNNSFALAAVRRNLHPHLQHSDFHIKEQISSFVKLVSGTSTVVPTPGTKGPKVLGDLVESIAGAVLIDSKLNLDEVWKVCKPILSPIVTPDKLELPPTREPRELCDSFGYFIKEHSIAKGDAVHAVLKLQLEDVVLDGQGSGNNGKAAKGMASLSLLKELEFRGIKSSRWKEDMDNVSSESTDIPGVKGFVKNSDRKFLSRRCSYFHPCTSYQVQVTFLLRNQHEANMGLTASRDVMSRGLMNVVLVCRIIVKDPTWANL